MDTDSQFRADRTEVDRLLHQLRSTLARLKAELELLDLESDLALAGPLESVDDAIAIVGDAQRVLEA